MSTNFHILCDCGFQHHIGKRTFQNETTCFTFRQYGNPELKTQRDWMKHLSNLSEHSEIIDEYDKTYTYFEFRDIINNALIDYEPFSFA